MTLFTIPPPGHTSENSDEIDGPRPFIKIHSLSFNRRCSLNTRSFMIQNKTSISLPPNQWTTIDFPTTIVTSLPAKCLVTCDTRTLYNRRLTQHAVIHNTNDTYLTIPLHNDTKNLITLRAYELMIYCTIILQEKKYV